MSPANLSRLILFYGLLRALAGRWGFAIAFVLLASLLLSPEAALGQFGPGVKPPRPQNLVVTTEPGSLDVTLDWDDVEGADSYTVWWREVRDIRLRGQTSVQSSHATINVVRHGKFAVSVNACKTGNCGPAEVQMVQVVDLPAQPSRLRSTTEPDSLHVSLDWDEVAGADSYTVRWRERVPGTQLNEGISVTNSSANITVTGSGEWVARVVACSGDNCGPPTFTRFQVTTPCGNGVIIPNSDDKPELVADCEAMWAARDILNPAGNALATWNAEAALGAWHGVTVGGDPQRVVNLVLTGSALNGTIPGALGNLTELVTLSLEKTGMYGEVPSELGSLTNLFDLSVSYNRLSGSVPASLGNLTKAWGIHLNNNQFTGPIPPEFGNLDTEHFHLSDNKFSGSIPPELANIKSLGGLFLQNNRLTGKIPDELKNANRVHTVALENNGLTGEIPDWFGDRPYLVVTLQSNQLTGTIPDLSGMSYVRRLRLGGNSLTGCVADSLRSQIFSTYSSTPPYGEVGAPFCADGTLAAPASLTVSLENEATSHDSSDSFTFDLRFSEEVKLSYKSLRDHVFTVTGGTVTRAQRLDKPSNIRWQITVQPDSSADVTVVLPVTTDCDAQGAICTKIGGLPLSNTASVTVRGPVENSPADH